MALTKTTTELAEAVLRELGVFDATESPETIDQTFVVAAYGDKYAELQDRELAYWSQTAIPTTIFLTVRDLTINEVRGAFGEPMSAMDKENQEIIILRQLRRHTQVRASGHATQTDYF